MNTAFNNFRGMTIEIKKAENILCIKVKTIDKELEYEFIDLVFVQQFIDSLQKLINEK